MAKTVFDVLRDNIGVEKASALDFLENRDAKDFAQYKEITGLIRGLKARIE